MELLLPAETSGNLIGQVHLADCLDLCERVYRAGVRVDMILADLPYGTTACAWDTIIPFEPMWKAFKRIIKPRGAIVLTATDPFSATLKVSNLEWFKYTMVWKKTRGSGFINAKNQPISIHEDICVFSPGTVANCSPRLMTYNPQGLIYAPYHKKRLKPMTAKAGGFLGQRPSHVSEYDVEYINYPTSVIEFANPNNDNDHPTQKPVALFQYLIRTYTEVGQVVFDPTCGSGTTGLAATIEKRRFICGDSDPGYVDVARNRLRMHNGDVSDLPLFAQVPA